MRLRRANSSFGADLPAICTLMAERSVDNRLFISSGDGYRSGKENSLVDCFAAPRFRGRPLRAVRNVREAMPMPENQIPASSLRFD